MAMLIAGVVLWSVTHLLPSVATELRAKLVGRFGIGPYKGLFSLDILIALLLMVFGWISATPYALYQPPLSGSVIPVVLLALAIILLVASTLPNNLRRFIRHPQMTAVVVWGFGHLLTNGDSRSVVLFGGLSIWAVLEMLFINRRDGQWQKPVTVSMVKDVIIVVAAAAAITLLVLLHASLFGVPAISSL
jgi:uncharacterized membrane protein